MALRHVYLLRSVDYPEQIYTGITCDLSSRLAKHNKWDSAHTSKWRPWHLITAIRFEDDERAVQFERYLKTGSGRAFAKRHVW
jgi:putative endonuclease